MSHRLRIIVASAQLAVALAGTFVVATQITITYYLPPASTGFASRETALFAPAVVGSVVGILAVLGLAAFLVVAVRHRPPRWAGVGAVVLTLIAVGVPMIVVGLDRPTF